MNLLETLSETQKNIWITQSKYPNSTMYNIGGYAKLTGNVQTNILRKAILTCINESDIFERYLKFESYEKRRQEDLVEYSDLSFSLNADALVCNWMQADMKELLDLNDFPLKAKILKSSEDTYYWYVKAHHIVMDGYSMSVLFSRISLLYTSITTGTTVKQSNFRFSDFISDEKKYRTSSEYIEDKRFWENKLSKMPTREGFYSCMHKPRTGPYLSFRREITIKRSEFDKITKYCDSIGVSPTHYFISIIILLNKLYNNDPVALGIPVFNRSKKSHKHTLGTFVNIFPFFLDPSQIETFEQLVIKVKNELTSCYRHHKFSISDILEETGGENPYNLLFSHQKNIYQNNFRDLNCAIKYLHNEEQREDLRIHLLEYSSKEDLILCFDYKLESFSDYVISNLINNCYTLVGTLYKRYGEKIDNIEIVSLNERLRILHEFNNTEFEFSENGALIHRFEHIAATFPDKVALVYEDNKLLYSDLNALANQMAGFLTSFCQVKPSDLVGINLEPSLWTVVSIISVLKCGAAYVPLDPDSPIERKNRIISNSNCKLIIDNKVLESFIKTREAFPTSNTPIEISEKNLVYVIYTSGTTGVPKGVPISNSNIGNYINSIIEKYHITSNDKTLLLPNIWFDGVKTALFGALLTGGCLHIMNKTIIRSPLEFVNYCVDKEITFIKITPSLLRIIFSTGSNFKKFTNSPHLKMLFIGGEKIEPSDISRIWHANSRIKIINHYGPTEATVGVSTYVYQGSEETIPIGNPLHNTKIFVLGSNNKLLPIGVIGEIAISGSCLSKGYLNSDDLTNEVFVQNPITGEGTIYKTGDLGKWNESGAIEIIGRKDTQIKIQGNRVELSEIEKAISESLNLAQVIVLPQEDHGEIITLSAYIVNSEPVDVSGLRDRLATRLPVYMYPGKFFQIPYVPTNQNGKIAQTELLALEKNELEVWGRYIAPETEIQSKLQEIWVAVLRHPKISIKDNFFFLGGNSLKAVQVANRINNLFDVSIELKDLFVHTTIEEQEALLTGKFAKEIQIPQCNIQNGYTLSSAQKRLWGLNKLGADRSSYNMTGGYLLEGSLNKNALLKAFGEIQKRHAILRTEFREDETGCVKQFVKSPEQLKIEIEFTNSNYQVDDMELDNLLEKENSKEFNLENGPLIRMKVFGFQSNQSLLLVSMHHIISDGWSIDILIKELSLLYNSFLPGETPLNFAPLDIQYGDYAEWQQKSILAGKLQDSKKYWLQKLSGELPQANIFSHKEWTSGKLHNGQVMSWTIPAAKISSLNDRCQKVESTCFTKLISILNLLFYKYSGSTDIILGTPVSCRMNYQLEGQVGLYVNTVPIRTNFNPEMNYLELLAAVAQVTTEALEHQSYPFDEMVSDLNLGGVEYPIFDTLAVFQSESTTNRMADFNLHDLKVISHHVPRVFKTKFNLTFHFMESKDTIVLSIRYNSEVYSLEQITRIGKEFKQLLDNVIQNPEAPIFQISCLTVEDHMKLLEFNKTTLPLPLNETVVQLFESQTCKTPNNVALVYDNRRLSYKEVNEHANQLAHYLRSQYKILPDDIIGIQVPRNEWVIISILGVLKAGAAYLPLDTEYPEERINYIISDCTPKAILDERELRTFKESRKQYPATNLECKANLSNLAYVIYTSGSTGRPKGVLIEHRSVTNYLLAFAERHKIREDFLFTSSISFDASIKQLFLSIIGGGKIYVHDELKNTIKLSNLIIENNLGVLNSTPGLVKELLSIPQGRQALGKLRSIIIGGESLSTKLVSDLLDLNPNVNVINAYGPTETCCNSTTHLCQRTQSTMPIGKPLANTRIYILGKHLELLPPGALGEICISGEGLARGYLKQPELTAKKFINNPYEAGQRMYRTGDLGMWQEDGNLITVGRLDSQVKIRGYRIELEEIQQTLLKHPGIKDAIVLVRMDSNDNKSLIAFYQAEEEISPLNLKTFLIGYLPLFMIPDSYFYMTEFPLTSTGKVDKASLQQAHNETAYKYIAPRSIVEKKLAAIWINTLNKTQIGIKSSFFELGGQSVKATLLASQIKKEFGINFTVKDVFLHPTLEQQALLIAENSHRENYIITQVAESTSYELSYAQRRIWLLHQFEEIRSAYNMVGAFTINGELRIDILELAINDLVERHEILRTIFKENDALVVQQIVCPASEMPIKFHIIDTIGQPSASTISELAARFSSTPFSLDIPPLLRVTIIKEESEKYTLLISIHHIICDGWSIKTLISELLTFYSARLNGVLASLPPLKIQYKDYSAWLNGAVINGKLDNERQYWLGKLKGELSPVKLNVRQGANTISFKGDRIIFKISEDIASAVKKQTQNNGGTEFSFYLSAFITLLYLETKQPSLIVGVPTAGRNHPALNDQIGFYVNILALKAELNPALTFESVLRQTQVDLIEGLNNQMYPFDLLCEELSFERHNNFSGFINTGFTWNEFDNRVITIDNSTTVIPVRLKNEFVKHDLWLVGNNSDFLLEYRSELFNKSYIETLVNKFTQLITLAARDSSHPLSYYLEHLANQKPPSKKRIEINLNI